MGDKSLKSNQKQADQKMAEKHKMEKAAADSAAAYGPPQSADEPSYQGPQTERRPDEKLNAPHEGLELSSGST